VVGLLATAACLVVEQPHDVGDVTPDGVRGQVALPTQVRLEARERLGQRRRQGGSRVGGGLGHALNLRRGAAPVKQPRRAWAPPEVTGAPAASVAA
jgi:hypothetical protein